MPLFCIEGTLKILNIQTPKKNAVIILKFVQDGFTKSMHPKDAAGIANSVDPDQTAPLGLFAQAYLSENLGSSRYAIKGQIYMV